MNAIADRLAELGLALPALAKPAGAYVPAVVTGNLVYTAGQLPWVDGALPATGKVGAEVSADEAHQLARACVLNALAALAGRDRLARPRHPRSSRSSASSPPPRTSPASRAS